MCVCEAVWGQAQSRRGQRRRSQGGDDWTVVGRAVCGVRRAADRWVVGGDGYEVALGSRLVLGSSTLGKRWASSYRVRSTTASATECPVGGREEVVVEKLENAEAPSGDSSESTSRQLSHESGGTVPTDPDSKAARVQSAEHAVESQKAEAGKRG